MNLYVEVHVLQPIPPSNVNRDDTGAPKTAIFGGVRRSRISSQAWKRAVREDFRDRLGEDFKGVRSVKLVERLAGLLVQDFPDLAEQAQSLAVDAFKIAGFKVAKPKAKKDQEEENFEVTGYLVFLSNQQLKLVANLVGTTITEGREISSIKKDVISTLKSNNSYDLALFGRMVADNSALNVEAAAQVAHAIGVSKVETEYDYFTAVDDAKDQSDVTDAGAAMIGSIAFNSSTVYRYANVSVGELAENLGDTAATAKAVRAFVDSFVTTMPTGKQNTFANRTLPTSLLVTIRSDQPVSLAPAFESPIYPTNDKAISVAAAEALAAYAHDLYGAYGNAPEISLAQGIGEGGLALTDIGELVNLPEMLDRVQARVQKFVEEVTE